MPIIRWAYVSFEAQKIGFHFFTQAWPRVWEHSMLNFLPPLLPAHLCPSLVTIRLSRIHTGPWLPAPPDPCRSNQAPWIPRKRQGQGVRWTNEIQGNHGGRGSSKKGEIRNKRSLNWHLVNTHMVCVFQYTVCSWGAG